MKKNSTPKKGQKQKKSAIKSSYLENFKKISLAIIILISLVIAAGFLAPHIIKYKNKPVKTKITNKTVPQEKTFKIQHEQSQKKVAAHNAHKYPTYEIFPKEEPLIPYDIPDIPPKKQANAAIIIDDLGYDKKIADKFLNLGLNFTFSVFPNSPFQQDIVDAAIEKGYEIMLHIPMEPIEYPAVDPGERALISSMNPDQLTNQLESDLNSTSHAKGVNNHMGSKLTSNSIQMYQIFAVLKKYNLFFIDSKTTPNSQAKSSARLFQVPFAQRDIFIDHILEAESIKKQIRIFINIAVKNGEAVGIAHPHEITYQIISEMLPEIQKKINLISASKITRIPH